MWITNEAQLGRMLTAVRATWNCEPDLWWRDELALGVAWNGKGWSRAPRQGCGALACGKAQDSRDVVVWIYRSGVSMWAVEGFGLSQAADWLAWGKKPEGAITLFNARDHGGPPKQGAISVGQYVGWMDGKKIHVGKARSVTAAGNAEMVELVNGSVVHASELGAKRVWKIDGRDEALAWFWAKGETTFAGYPAMKMKLFHKQRAVTGDKTIGKHPRGMAVPDHHNDAERPINDRDLAAKVARLKLEYSKAEQAFEQVNAGLLATAEGTAEATQAMALRDAAEAAMAEAWDAWDAAEKQWIAELMN